MKFVLLMLFALPLIASVTQGQDEGAIQERSLVSMGDTARLQHVLAKARRGEKVVVGVIGGSITAGAVASTEENRWGNRVAQWWRDTFPQAKVEFVNAGIGATGSNLGCHRVARQLLVDQPDFVVAEYGVNDPNTELAAETLEGLVRQILKQPNQPAVMLLFTMHQNGTNAQEWHGKIGEHYGLPMVSMRDALWPEIEAGRMAWEDVEGDIVHPNDRGHAYCADFITQVLDTVLRELRPDAQLPQVAPVPGPVISGLFEHTTMANAEEIVPEVNEGWNPVDMWPFGKAWEATNPGSVLEFELEGTAISVAFYRIKGDMGMASAQTDGGEPQILQGWFEADWGGYTNWQLVARDLAPGTHRLRIELLDQTAEESNGHKFQVQLVMSAGIGGAN